jgi:hypothetical protein
LHVKAPKRILAPRRAAPKDARAAAVRAKDPTAKA